MQFKQVSMHLPELTIQILEMRARLKHQLNFALAESVDFYNYYYNETVLTDLSVEETLMDVLGFLLNSPESVPSDMEFSDIVEVIACYAPLNFNEIEHTCTNTSSQCTRCSLENIDAELIEFFARVFVDLIQEYPFLLQTNKQKDRVSCTVSYDQVIIHHMS